MEKNHYHDQDIGWLFDLVDIKERIKKRTIKKPADWVIEPDTVAGYAVCYMYMYLKKPEVTRNPINR